ncbi:MAG TPA: hypothetical protein ACFYEK_16420 [Candidatus Wunengus sp. YC60]|uniref:hypothetical protein n=1 Tax=Candidatus Wunengus sp. YC60 TaxID=3367697 RepID=UPI0040263506
MTPEHKIHKKISKGEAIYRRRVLAEARRTTVFDVSKRIIEKEAAKDRLDQIDGLLFPEGMELSVQNPQEREQIRAGLEVERIWLLLRIGMIGSAEKQRMLSDKFERLEKSMPDVYHWLTDRNGNELTMAEKIRDKVMPSIRVSGFYAKR